MSKGSDWLEPVLAEHLHPIKAPEGIWERIRIEPVTARMNLRPAWVIAAAVPVLAAEKLEVTVEAKTNDVPIHLHRGRPARR